MALTTTVVWRMGIVLEGRMCCAPLFYLVISNFDYFPGVPISGVEVP